MIRTAASLLCKGATIGYISDVHSEFHKGGKAVQHLGRSNCDVLVLAGDIGNPFSHDGSYRKFLEACTGTAKHTLVMAGNHEYYQGNRYSMSQTKMKMTSVCGSINSSNLVGKVHFIDNDAFVYQVPESGHKIRFICSTLWSDISKEHEFDVYKSIRDYELIMGFTPSLSRKLYRDSCEFINERLMDAEWQGHDRTNIVVTHHAPSTTGVSAPCYLGSPLTSAFATDFKYFGGKAQAHPPYAWIFGHTHFNVARWDTQLGTILLSNQVGYPGEDCGMVCDWDAEKTD